MTSLLWITILSFFETFSMILIANKTLAIAYKICDNCFLFCFLSLLNLKSRIYFFYFNHTSFFFIPLSTFTRIFFLGGFRLFEGLESLKQKKNCYLKTFNQLIFKFDLPKIVSKKENSPRFNFQHDYSVILIVRYLKIKSK